MSAIFTLPRQVPIAAGVILAGAKLTFSQTGTSTLQDTYTTNARLTPHANPVVADANGVFAPIYLDPTLPDYRVRLTTAANVLVYQEDGVPSNQNTQQSMRLQSTDPFLFFEDTDGTVGSRKYRIRAAGNAFQVQMVNDAENLFTTAFSITAGTVDLNGGATAGGVPLSLRQNGNFTATYTGFTTTPTEACTYEINGGVTTIHLTGISATSNAVSMTITGLPSAIRPGFTRSGLLCRVTDNGGAVSLGTASISSGGVITFGFGVAGAAFTASGTKSLLPSTLAYRLDNNG